MSSLKKANDASQQVQEKIGRGEKLTADDYTNLLNAHQAAWDAAMNDLDIFNAFYADKNLGRIKRALHNAGYTESFDETANTYTVKEAAAND